MSVSLPAGQAEQGQPASEGQAASWNFVFSTYLPALVLALGAGIALPAIPLLAKSFNVSFGVASLVITAFLIGGTAGSLPTGALIDRLGHRPIMIAGPLLTSAMALLVMTAHGFPKLLLFRFIDGWAAQMWLMGRLTSISAYSSSGQRGRQVVWMLNMDNSGKLAGPLAGGFIAGAWGLRSPFAAYAVLALVAAIPAFIFTANEPAHHRSKRPANVSLPAAMRQMVLPRLALFGVAFFGAVSRGPVGGGLLHLYAAFTYNLDPQAIGILATSGSSTLVPIGFAAGYLLDRLGRKKTIVPGYVSFTLCMLCIATTAFLHLPLGWYVASFIGVVASQGLTVGSTQTIGADVAPAEGRGTFLGLWQTTNLIGSSTSPLVFGFLADWTGYGWSFVFLAAASLTVSVLLLTSVTESGGSFRPRSFRSAPAG